MGDYSGCMELENANYCSLRIPSVSWTGLCLPSSCNIDNVRDSYRIASAQSIANLGTLNLQSLQLSQPEPISELDQRLIKAGIEEKYIKSINSTITMASLCN